MAHLFPHRPNPSSTLSASIRARAGITQMELGDLLGVSRGQVAHVEAGRRGYSRRAQERLRRLAELLPVGSVAEAGGEEPVPAGPTAEERLALRRRLRTCRRQLTTLVYAAEGRPVVAEALSQRRQALATLRAALAAEAAPAPARAAREAAWLELVELATHRVARRQPTPTRLAWEALRLRLLREEEAGLLALLAAPA